MGRWTLFTAGSPSCWHVSGLLHAWDVHGALARLLNHHLDPHFCQRHKLLLCTAVNLDIWFPLTAKLTNQLNSDTFYVLSSARLNVFQAQHSAEEFGFTGSGVNCKLFTTSISLTELGSNSCVHLSVSELGGDEWIRGSWPGEAVPKSWSFTLQHAFLAISGIISLLISALMVRLVYTCSPDFPWLSWRAVTPNNKALHLHSILHFLKLNNINYFVWSCL